jgi:CubicO group peptidase (beta-lactamase class C family)
LDPDLEALKDYLDGAERIGFSGAVSVADRTGSLFERGYGYADWAAGRPMTPQTIFNIGSVSKQFTAAAILKLEEMGRLNVEDPITRFFEDVPADKRSITLHQLLTHTAGFVQEVRSATFAGSPEEMIALTLAAPLQGQPGGPYSYSNAGYSLLGAVVSIASGEPYVDFVRRSLWEPAGMTDSGWWTSAPVERRAFGYANAAASPHPDQSAGDGPPWSRRGPGALASTPQDLHRWVAALREGRVLSDASLRKMLHAHVVEEPQGASFYGYGLVIMVSAAGVCTVGHDGANSLHYNFLRLYPERGLTVHALTLNERGPVGRPIVRSIGAVLFNGAPAPAPATAPMAPAEAERLAGRWRADNGDEIEFIARGSRVLAPTSRSNVARFLTPFEPLSQEDDRRTSTVRSRLPGVIDALAQGDYGPLAPMLPGGVTIEEERRYWSGQWDQWRALNGSYQGAEVVATARQGDQLTTYLLLRFERSGVMISAVHGAEGSVAFGTRISSDTADEFVPSEYVVASTGPNAFAVFNPSFAGSMRLDLDAQGETMRLSGPRGERILRRISRPPS